ncbi:motility associated factor glycosyltransferase family protein [Campylobacter lari]|uniref:motility associated factor glycosyltransferase family protein n=1 Tax=Campylobacter lari TaxID=201 RepID=UPI001BD9C4AE|nr:motility associated factor glycosyltransferase family protein [Campylobacter lari]MBT0816489.1 motility associated factor glycosyltransferase family protein [Campylobacter lari]
MNELFLKNTQALFEKDQPLALKLRELKECEQFELFQGSSDNLDINILDKKRKEFVYKDPLKELDESLKLFNGEYLRYPVLFFYGLGNGILYKALLSNPIRNHLIIFEEELEIIYLVFHYLDLSEEIRNEKVVLFYTPLTTFTQLDVLMSYSTIRNYYKIYNLFIHSNFYSSYNTNTINQDIIQAIKSNHLRVGNAPSDSLQGITQLTRNLVSLLTNPSLKDLLKQRKGKIENAIIVSTGPSLMKQLPLLKEYANKASIICADSAYPILAKHNIKPDYVLMLERDDVVAKCFDNDFKEFDKGILFVLASLVSPKTIEYLKRNNRQFMLVHRSLPFARILKLNDYGYISGGMSVANMAYELAIKLGHKNIILIGQDLAYDENGNSHPKEYLHTQESENDRKEGLFITAYGGNGKVETNKWWKVFKDIFEKDIIVNKNKSNITTYNATEGGARIEGSIEKSFKELCENFLKENKPLFKTINTNTSKIGVKLKTTRKNMEKILSYNQNNINKSQILLEKIQKAKINLKVKSLFRQLDAFKKQLYKISNGAYELYPHILYHHELKINKLLCKNPKTEIEQEQVIKDLLNEYEETFKILLHLFNVFDNTIKMESIELFQLTR